MCVSHLPRYSNILSHLVVQVQEWLKKREDADSNG
jgi:hypothetical protein